MLSSVYFLLMAIEEVIRSKETELLNLYNYQSVLVLDLSLD